MKEWICREVSTSTGGNENGVLMMETELIRCKDCGQREYGCSTFIDHNQIYGFCAWGWKAERKEENESV